jgi:adenylate cyclase
VVNTASRLEAETKTYGCQLIVSEALAERAGIDLSGFPHHEIEVRGRSATLGIRAIPLATELPEIETGYTRRKRRGGAEVATAAS